MNSITVKNQKGVVLIIAFFIMTIIIAVVLSIGTILFREIKAVGSAGNSVSAFYAAESGIEKVLYADRRQVPLGANRGMCNICNVCSNFSSSCSHCVTIPLATNGCNILNCNNCQASFDSITGGNFYTVKATVSPDGLIIGSQGTVGDVTREVVNTSR